MFQSKHINLKQYVYKYNRTIWKYDIVTANSDISQKKLYVAVNSKSSDVKYIASTPAMVE